MPTPIPLQCKDNGGTGFLVTDGEKVWLVTCVHIITGMAKAPAIPAFFEATSVSVVTTGLTIPLMPRGIQRFKVVTGPDGMLVDVISIELDASEAAALAIFGTYNVASIVAPQGGELVNAVGFKGIGSGVLDTSTLTAEVEQIVGQSIQLSAPSAPGYSGAAAVTENGLIGILHGDLGAAPHLTNGLVIAFSVVGPHLFY